MFKYVYCRRADNRVVSVQTGPTKIVPMIVDPETYPVEIDPSRPEHRDASTGSIYDPSTDSFDPADREERMARFARTDTDAMLEGCCPSLIVAVKRAAEYPPLGNQLDAVLKYIEATAKPEDLPDDLKDVMDRWRAVKERHPKPPPPQE